MIRVSSTLLSALVLTAWAGSTLVTVTWLDAPANYRALVARGAVDVSYFDESAFEVSHCGGGMPIQPPPTWTIRGVRFEYGGYERLFPFQWRPRFGAEGGYFWALVVPLWMPLAPLVTVAGVTNVRAARDGRRLRANTCARCGYSRIGLSAGWPCPECGTTSRT
jgi:hypothetical protein